ncbi:hypothetical protein C1I98_33320 [Spongiactinospora gelatinilytica]|uniref:Uncharacterized protein n=1 Tax=Spongiactinospora gelatinilytica TaxID=2666298 RepID=A0A2W2ESJ5_9ACTN|nr:hypothetical protein C1I98_33320 [Spongiactinospora gelatinilytica]
MSTPALSPARAASVADAATAWTTVAYATGPADRPAAEEGVRAAYREAGLAEPERFIWFASPAQAARRQTRAVTGRGWGCAATVRNVWCFLIDVPRGWGWRPRHDAFAVELPVRVRRRDQHAPGRAAPSDGRLQRVL